MATLVLTAVGTALGGPIGGALGAILGQQADAALFAPKARQGARLSDLRVQTSSYGDAIPRLFGTLRVAGTVIWATDLIERRQKRSQGKGRPKIVEYSYAASLAVAVSARPIRRVGRIWADGSLLRDGTGKLAETVVVRVHDGSPDQAVDPLIASMLGMTQASAFRGLAYVMLEELDLTAFGNRIPQLSFEVVADDGPVSAPQIAGELVGRAVAAGPGAPLVGYAASGERVREAIGPLTQLAQLGLQRDPAGWRLAAPDAALAAPANPALARVHADAQLMVDSEQRTALGKVAAAISVRHYDPARDFQTSVQSAVVAGGGARPSALELPGAMDAGAARGEAQRLAFAAGDGRRTATARAGLGALALPMGAILPLDIAGAQGTRWRIAERVVDDGGARLKLIQQTQSPPAAALAGDGGAAVTPGDLPGGTTSLAIFDVPGDGETLRAGPLRLVAAAGSDPLWRGCDLWWVSDPGAEPEAIGRIGSALALGVLTAPVPAMTSILQDRASAIIVQLTNAEMMLGNISHERLIAGGNRAMLGEAIQFQRATPLGSGLWRLEGLLRGRGGTEDVAGPHGVGTAFALIDDAALLPLPDSMAARAVTDGAVIERQERGSVAMAAHPVPPGARSIVPLSPVHGRVWRTGDGGRRVTWIPRSRVGARWRDGVEVPPGESRARWRVQYRDANDVAQDIEVEAAQVELPANGFAAGSVLNIIQLGDFAASAPLLVPLN